MSASLSVLFLSHVTSREAPTGAERSLALLASGIRRKGNRAAVAVVGPWALEDELREEGVEVVRAGCRQAWLAYHDPRPWPEALARWARYAAPDPRLRGLRRAIRRFGPNVVHVNCLPNVRGALAAKREGLPVVWHVREILPAGPRRRWFAAHLARCARTVVAVSEAVAAWLREEGLGKRVEVIHNGIPSPRPGRTPERAREKLGIPSDGVLVVLFGQLLPHKGTLEFVEAAARALDREPDLRFALAGPAPAKHLARLRRAVERRGLQGRVQLLPPQRCSGDLIAASDVVCVATRTPDPLPRSVLEAMAGRRPVVASRSGGSPEMVVDGRTGLLVPPGNVEEMARAFVRLARDPSLRRAMGEEGARRAGERFSPDVHVERMEKVLREAAFR